MLIEMWTDFVWPFCYIGKRRLEDALQKIEHPVEVVYRCFELDPTAERDVGYNIYENLASKYGMSIEEAKASSRNIEQMARTVGLDYHFDTAVLTNTFDAHRLAMFAKSKGLMNEMTEKILHAYYTDSKHIGDHTTLTELAVEVGLNREAVAEMLASNDMSNSVRADEQEANQLGIRSIPFFLINKKHSISGAQSSEAIVASLQKIIKEDGPFTNVNDTDGTICGVDGCEVPKK